MGMPGRRTRETRRVEKYFALKLRVKVNLREREKLRPAPRLPSLSSSHFHLCPSVDRFFSFELFLFQLVRSLFLRARPAQPAPSPSPGVRPLVSLGYVLYKKGMSSLSFSFSNRLTASSRNSSSPADVRRRM